MNKNVFQLLQIITKYNTYRRSEVPFNVQIWPKSKSWMDYLDKDHCM